MRRLWVFALVAACYNEPAFAPCFTACGTDDRCPPGLECGGNGYCRSEGGRDCSPMGVIPIDALVVDDAPPDAPISSSGGCFGNGLLEVCIDPLPTNTIELAADTTIDTSDSTNCAQLQPQTNGPTVCVITAQNYNVPAGRTLRVIGTRPLAIVASQAMGVYGTIDASSTVGAGLGAGANSSLCAMAVAGTNGQTAMGGAGGGAGGALTTLGGEGGAGSGGFKGGSPKTPTTAVTSVRGGCAGARGGNYGINQAGAGGNGGGAIYLIAGSALSVSGVINASGSGGFAPQERAGGGGGGSGGFIGLDAMSYSIQAGARIFASGGSGASGGDTEKSGNPGNEARDTGDPVTTPAVGSSGAGGAGASQLAGDNGQAAGTNTGSGGGGGGGGGGYIGIENLQSFPPVFRPPAVEM